MSKIDIFINNLFICYSIGQGLGGESIDVCKVETGAEAD